MSDAAMLLCAAAVSLAAWLAPPVPLIAAVSVLVLAGVVAASGRSAGPTLPAVAIAGLMLLAGSRAHHGLAALEAPLPRTVQGTATLVDDPETARFGYRVTIAVEGRRYMASAPFDKGAALRDLATGDRVVVKGRPSPLRNAPAGWVRSRHLAGRIDLGSVTFVADAGGPLGVANSVRRVVSAGAQSFTDTARPQYLGMVVGDDRGQNAAAEFRFRASGLTHVLVVSGQNVAFLLAIAAPALRHLPIRARTVSSVALLVVFVLVTRADPSVLRAATMAALVVVATSAGRLAPAGRILALAVTALVLVDPLIVHSLGFQLSVAATTGLVLGARRVGHNMPGPEVVTLPLAVTMCAQVATAPLLLSTMGWISPTAPITNLLAGPAAAMVMMSGVTVGPLAGLLDERIASVVQVPARLGVAWVDTVARIGSNLPLAALTPLRAAWLGLGLATAAWLWRSERPHRSLWSAVALAIGALALVPAAIPPGVYSAAEGVELVVGRCGGRAVSVIGAGDEAAVLEALWLQGVRSVDVVLTGPGRSERRVANTIVEQFGGVGPVGPDDEAPEFGALQLGHDDEGLPVVSEGSCTVAP